MPLEPPGWWYRPHVGVAAALLQPVSLLVSAVARLRHALARPVTVSVPVICVGNFIVGGGGKTPLALHVAELAARRGARPFFLSRGHGGRMAGPHRVDPEQDGAREVGDEPLLLARRAPTVVARDRPAGAALAIAEGASLIIMDDGFQNPSLHKDLSIVAVDGARGIGNGCVMPSGPLRAPLAMQLPMADALVITEAHGDGGPHEAAERLARSIPCPVIHASVRPAASAAWLRGARVVAFAGLARPSKLFDTLTRLGADLVEARAFPDHHVYGQDEARDLLALASDLEARLVTTEKDHVRLPAVSGPLGRLRERAWPLPIALAFEAGEAARLETLLDIVLRQAERKEDG